jgi:chromosome segregation ATPase
MSLASERDDRPEYNDIRARRALARTIVAHQAKVAELANLRAAISQAEAKLAAMQSSIDEPACAEDELAEAAANALRSGKDVSSAAWKAKEKRGALISEHALLKSGFDRLQARALGLEREVAAAYADLSSAREPIIQAQLDGLACELARREDEAATLRNRLRGFSM